MKSQIPAFVSLKRRPDLEIEGSFGILELESWRLKQNIYD